MVTFLLRSNSSCSISESFFCSNWLKFALIDRFCDKTPSSLNGKRTKNKQTPLVVVEPSRSSFVSSFSFHRFFVFCCFFFFTGSLTWASAADATLWRGRWRAGSAPAKRWPPIGWPPTSCAGGPRRRPWPPTSTTSSFFFSFRSNQTPTDWGSHLIDRRQTKPGRGGGAALVAPTTTTTTTTTSVASARPLGADWRTPANERRLPPRVAAIALRQKKKEKKRKKGQRKKEKEENRATPPPRSTRPVRDVQSTRLRESMRRRRWVES